MVEVLEATEAETVKLSLDVIRTDGGTQARAGLDQETVDDYVHAMVNDAEFPPVVVFHDGEHNWLADGFHRVAAARKISEPPSPFPRWIWTEIRQGTRRDAILYAAGANANHGLRRTNADKWRAVERLLVDEEWGQWSDREIARRCQVSHPFVAQVRSKLGDRDRPQYAPPPLDTGNITSIGHERTFIHPKTGEPTTMNTAAIGANGTGKAEAEPIYTPIWQLERNVSSYLDAYAEMFPGMTMTDEKRIEILTGMKKLGYGHLLSSGRLDEPYRKRDVTQAVNNVLEQLRQKERGRRPAWEPVNMRSGWTCSWCKNEYAAGSGAPMWDGDAGQLVCDQCLEEPLEDGQSPDTSNVLLSSDTNEWYTPAEYVEAARATLGRIDLDPASIAAANKVVKASIFYTAEDDGLAQEWAGKVWLNPPYGKDGADSNAAMWSEKLIEEYRAGNVEAAVLLVNATPGNRWWAPLWDFPICFPDHRIKFWRPGEPRKGPTHSSAFVYLGPRPDRFIDNFRQFGPVVTEVKR